MTPVPSLPPLRFQPARDSAFRRELRERADAYLASEGKHRFGDARLHVKTVFLAALTAGLYALALNADSTWPFVASYVACLVAAMTLAMPVLYLGWYGARDVWGMVFLAALLVHGLDGARRLWWPAAAGTRA